MTIFAAAMAALAALAQPAAGASPPAATAEQMGRAHARDGDFTALLVVTPDVDAFHAAWAGPTPPNLVTTERVTREKPVFGMVIFSGCTAGADGNCRLIAHFSMEGPGGAPYGTPHSGPGWDGPPAPGHALQLSMSSLGFSLDPGDPPGRYILRATLRDEVSGKALTVEKPVEADPE